MGKYCQVPKACNQVTVNITGAKFSGDTVIATIGNGHLGQIQTVNIHVAIEIAFAASIGMNDQHGMQAWIGILLADNALNVIDLTHKT